MVTNPIPSIPIIFRLSNLNTKRFQKIPNSANLNMSKDATINLDHKFMVTKMEIRKNPSFLHNKKPFGKEWQTTTFVVNSIILLNYF